jgi:hypothetical protein
MADAFAAGFKLRDLPNDTALADVEIRNDEIAAMIETTQRQLIR